jgi:hypothetical protein
MLWQSLPVDIIHGKLVDEYRILLFVKHLEFEVWMLL